MLPLSAQNRSTWERRPAQIHSSDVRGALTFPSTAAPTEIVAQYLVARGHDAATVRSITDSSTRGKMAAQASRMENGMATLRVDQRVNGLTVYGSYVKAAFNEQGQLVHLIENLAPVSSNIASASIDESQALGAALGRIHPAVSVPSHS